MGEEHPERECESVSVSDYSPCPVEDSETLVAVITSNKYITQDGLLEPTYFEHRMQNGVSTDRKVYTSKFEYDKRAELLIKNNLKKINFGSIEISVRKVRTILHSDGRRAIAVYDTAIKENRSHAEIVCTEVPLPGSPNRKGIRAKLRKNVLSAVLHDRKVLSSNEIFDQV